VRLPTRCGRGATGTAAPGMQRSAITCSRCASHWPWHARSMACRPKWQPKRSPAPRERTQLRTRLLAALRDARAHGVKLEAAASQDPIVRGWLEWARSPPIPAASLTVNPRRPAGAPISKHRHSRCCPGAADRAGPPRPCSIALLLPLTGRHRARPPRYAMVSERLLSVAGCHRPALSCTTPARHAAEAVSQRARLAAVSSSAADPRRCRRQSPPWARSRYRCWRLFPPPTAAPSGLPSSRYRRRRGAAVARRSWRTAITRRRAGAAR